MDLISIQNQIEHNYNLSIYNITPLRKVWLLYTNKGNFILKRATAPGKVIFMSSFSNHLRMRGLKEIIQYVPMQDGSLSFSSFDATFYLTKWIEGRECCFQKKPEVIAAARALACFHKASLGFSPPPGASVKQSWGKLPKKLYRRFNQLKEMKKKSPAVISAGEKALQILSSSNYGLIIEQAKKLKTVCHLDFAQNNLIWHHEKIHVLDLDNCKFDIPARDMEKFLRRTFVKKMWDLPLAIDIIKEYTKVYPVTKDEAVVLLALLTFPHNFWRAYKSFKKHLRTEDEFNRIVQLYSNQISAQRTFLNGLADFFGVDLNL